MKPQKNNSKIRDNEDSGKNSTIRKFGTMKTKKKFYNSQIRDKKTRDKELSWMGTSM